MKGRGIMKVMLAGRGYLVEETKNFPTSVLSPSLFVIHDAGTGSQDNVPKLTRRQ